MRQAGKTPLAVKQTGMGMSFVKSLFRVFSMLDNRYELDHGTSM
jgi:hypothetical protein